MWNLTAFRPPSIQSSMPRRLSDLGTIYCGGGIAVHIDAHPR